MYLVTALVEDHDENETNHVLFLCKKYDLAFRYVTELNDARVIYKLIMGEATKKVIELQDEFKKIPKPSVHRQSEFMAMAQAFFSCTKQEAEIKYEELRTDFESKQADYLNAEKELNAKKLEVSNKFFADFQSKVGPEIMALVNKYHLTYRFNNYKCKFNCEELDIMELEVFK